MSRSDIFCRPLSATGFAPFGDVLEASGKPDKIINEGRCGRFHDLARLDLDPSGRAGISLFEAEPRELPYEFTLMERHPLGSQAFLPMSEHPFLVIVAPDEDGAPGMPLAFLTEPGQGVNYHRGIWHGVLTPLHAPGRFAVIDWIGTTLNLEEKHFATPVRVSLP